MPGTNQRYNIPDWIFNLDPGLAVKLMLYGMFGNNAPDGTGLPVTGAPPVGGATAANQATQITAEQATQAAVEKVIPATTAAAVTPSDATALTSRAVWVGGLGDLSVRLSGAPTTTVVFTAVPAGTLLPMSVVRVMAATTATNINVLN